MASINDLKVLIVDDDVIFRKIITDVMNTIENVEVIDSAKDGEDALQKIDKNQPDLVLLDIEMPVLNGLETLIRIKKKYPNIIVIMVSGTYQNHADIVIECLNMGALDFIQKPASSNIQANITTLKASLSRLVSLSKSQKTIKYISETEKPNLEYTTKYHQEIYDRIKQTDNISLDLKSINNYKKVDDLPKSIDIIVIGVSTGGPSALSKFLPSLPSSLDVPILIVQHMPAMFTASLVEYLNEKCSLSVVEAHDHDALKPNTIYIAPGDKHMIVSVIDNKRVINLIDTPPVNSCKPSVDVLFLSIAKIYMGNLLAIVLTGMGSDGLNGTRELKKIKGYVITQSEDSCVVYGMPKSIVDAELSDESVHIDLLAARVTEIVKNPTRVKYA